MVVSWASGSQLSVSGPAAGLSAIVLAGITSVGYPAFLLAVVLAGAFQIALGFFRAGIIAYYFPSNVIRGLAVIAIIPNVISSELEIDPVVASFYGGTGLLIVISVALDLVQKINSHLVMRNYPGLTDD